MPTRRSIWPRTRSPAMRCRASWPANCRAWVWSDQAQLAHLAQERLAFLRVHVAQGRAQEEDERAAGSHPLLADASHRRVIVADVGRDAEIGIVQEQGTAADSHGRLGDVHRHVFKSFLASQQGVDQQAGLLPVATAELHQPERPAERVGDVTGMLAQDLRLAAGHVVFGKRGDRLEEARAQLVVEVLGIQNFGAGSETAPDIIGEVGLRALRPDPPHREALFQRSGGRSLQG